MFPTYTQKQSPAQKKDAPTAASILDASSQNESLQRKADMANNAAQREEAPHPNNTGMPDNLKSGIESLSGFSMDDVRVHYNSSKPATVQALAYTQGTDIHVAPGQEKCLPHEAWHVAQQMAGRVSPTTNINGMPVNDNAALEHEADVMGEKAMQMKADESKTVQRATIWNGVAQRYDNPYEYYYHISGTGIPADKEINPRYNLNDKGIRKDCVDRGDDLGPGFYMGDFDFLKYYYGKNFTSKDVFVYYIEKNLIDETMKENIKDFTEETAPKTTQETGLDNWFQIAMQLGFRFVDENKVDDNRRPLDLLAPIEKDETTDKIEAFKKCVKEIYGDRADEIISFFKNAPKKAIWKGFINDIDQGNGTHSITKEDIDDYFKKCGIEKICAKSLQNILEIDSSKADYGAKLNGSTESIGNELYDCVNRIYELILDEKSFNTIPSKFSKKPPIKTTQKDNIINKFKENIKSQSFAEGLANALPKYSITNEIMLSANEKDIKSEIYEFVKKNNDVFLKHKTHCTYNPLEINKVKPIQIAIRNDVKYQEKVEGGEKDVKLLDKIKSKMIYISKAFIEYTQHPKKGSKPEGYKLDPETLTGKLTSALANAKQEKEDEKKNSKTIPTRDK